MQASSCDEPARTFFFFSTVFEISFFSLRFPLQDQFLRHITSEAAQGRLNVVCALRKLEMQGMTQDQTKVQMTLRFLHATSRSSFVSFSSQSSIATAQEKKKDR